MTAVVDAPARAAAPAAPPASARVDLRALTGLRVVAALWVVLFHWDTAPPPELGAARELLSPVLASGYLGVELFFVVSGFVITLTYVDALGPRLRPALAARFLWARVCRVWPAYAVVTVGFGLWLAAERERVGPDRDIAYQLVQPELTTESWVRQLLMVQQWTEPYSDGVSFVGALWSVSAEMAAYVVFPLLALVLFRLRRLPPWLLGTLAVAAMAPVAWHALETADPYFAWSWAARLAAGFTAGALVCLAVRQVVRTPAVEQAARGTAALVVVVLLQVLVLTDRADGDPRGACVVLFPVLVGALALSTTGVAGALSSDAAVLGGRTSYSLYLVHVPLFEVFWVRQMQDAAIAPGGPYTALVLPGLLLVAPLLGYLLWRWVEEPARVRLRRLVER